MGPPTAQEGLGAVLDGFAGPSGDQRLRSALRMTSDLPAGVTFIVLHDGNGRHADNATTAGMVAHGPLGMDLGRTAIHYGA